MMILHVYNVSCFDRLFAATYNEMIVAMNTSEARDKLIVKYPHLERANFKDVTWHIHEITRFNVAS
jgi:hypothetical protein